MLPDFNDALLHLLAFLAGAPIVVGLLKIFLAKSLKDFEILLKLAGELKEQMIVVNVKLETLDKLRDLILEHDRKITMLEARKHAN